MVRFIVLLMALATGGCASLGGLWIAARFMPSGLLAD